MAGILGSCQRCGHVEPLVYVAENAARLNFIASCPSPGTWVGGMQIVSPECVKVHNMCLLNFALVVGAWAGRLVGCVPADVCHLVPNKT